MSSLALRAKFSFVSCLLILVDACGGSVGSESGSQAANTGGSALTSTGGLYAVGGSSGFTTVAGGGITALGGSSGGSTLPGRCPNPFDPGYSCTTGTPTRYYQFDQASGACEIVQYNGCGGATSGTFTDLSQCQALCEQRRSDDSCPVTESPGAACYVSGAICSYNFSSCLCTYAGVYSCNVTDPRCGTLGLNSNSGSRTPCTGEVCTVTQDIVIMTQDVCTCIGGIWACEMLYPW